MPLFSETPILSAAGSIGSLGLRFGEVWGFWLVEFRVVGDMGAGVGEDFKFGI